MNEEQPFGNDFQRVRKDRLLSEINVVPYVDIMLVLLVIFMVATPLVAQGHLVELAETEAEQLPQTKTETLTVLVLANGSYRLSLGGSKSTRIEEDLLQARLKRIATANPDVNVLVRADARVDFQAVAGVLAILENLDIYQVGLVTEPILDGETLEDAGS